MTDQETVEILAYNLLRLTAQLVPYRGIGGREVAREFRQGFEHESGKKRIAGYRSAILLAIEELVTRRQLAAPVASREREKLTLEFLPPHLAENDPTGSA